MQTFDGFPRSKGDGEKEGMNKRGEKSISY